MSLCNPRATVCPRIARIPKMRSRRGHLCAFCACAPGSRVHILGEPLGRQMAAEAALHGIAIDHGAGGGELVAEPEIVDEAGDSVSAWTAACNLAGDQIGKLRHAVKIYARSAVQPLPSLASGTASSLAGTCSGLASRV